MAKQRLKRVERYPLVLMLEPLFRCNLACAGCGKIDYPDPILNQRLSVAQCLEAVDECGAPVVSIAGGEPLLHREIEQIAEGIITRMSIFSGRGSGFPSPRERLRRRSAGAGRLPSARSASTTRSPGSTFG